VNNWSFQKLFNRRPTSATIGLAIAAISFFATLIQGVISIATSRSNFFFDFVYQFNRTVIDVPLSQNIIGIIWSTIGLIACYLALEPRNYARFTVLIAAGVKLFAFVSYSDQISMPLWRYLMILVIALLPVVLLLLRPSNDYYGRSQ
jgi:hypothetical protein